MEKPLLKFPIFLVKHDGKGYTAFIKGLDGVVAQGNTKDEAKTNLFKALDVFIELKSEDVRLEMNDDNVKYEQDELILEVAD